jgi:TonB-linked SusC/RagA family outer membrane protein
MQAHLHNHFYKRFRQQLLNASFIPKLLLVLLTFFASDAPLSASDVNTQDGIILKGHVSDQNNAPLQGASISIKGTTIGTIADKDGAFILKVPNADVTLTISFQGYISQEIPVKNHRAFDIKLEPAANTLKEVAVLGYTAVLKKDLTGSVSTLLPDEITRVQSNNIVSSLVGVPGVRVNGAGADVGDIRIHGNRSVLASNTPLIMLDGMPYLGSLNSIDQYDIASINILKDASSTALYGSKGANGVIVITTKTGTKGKNNITFDTFNGVNVHDDGNLHPMDATQYIQFKRQAEQAVGVWNSPADDSKIFLPAEIAGFGKVNSQAAQQFYNDLGFASNSTLTIMSGDDQGSKKISLNFYNNNGRGPGQDNLDRYMFSSLVDHQVLKHLRVGMSTRALYQFQQAAPANFGQNLFRYPPTVSLFDASGNPIVTPLGDPNMRNPYLDLNHDHNDSETREWEGMMKAYAIYSFSPALTLTTSANVDITFNWAGSYVDNQSSMYNNALNQASLTNNRSTAISGNSILEYKKKFGKHSIDATGVFEIQNNQSLNSAESGQGISLAQYKWYNLGAALSNEIISSGFTRNQMLSYVGRIQYGYEDKYLVTLTARDDGASPLANGHEWQAFPSVAVAWRAIDEPFVKDINAISDLKFRASYGLSGNSSIAPYGTQGNLTSRYTIFGSASGDVPYATNEPNLQPVTDLKWETTATLNLGLDYGLFHNRVTGSFDWYISNTYDLLNMRKLPYTTGFNTVYANIGKSKNTGYEAAINVKAIDNKDFKWRFTLSAYHDKEQLTQLYDPRLTQDIANNWFVGYPVSGVIYDYKAVGIWQTNEAATAAIYGDKPGDVKIQDLNGDGKIDGNDRQIVGEERPTIQTSLITNFSWKNFDTALDFYSEYGGSTTDSWTSLAYSSVGRYNVPVFDYWTPTNPTNNAPQPRAGLTPTYLSAIVLHSNNYIRLRNVTLGYTFSKNLIKGISKLRVYASATGPLQYWSYLQEGGLSDKTVIYNLGLNVSF